MKLLLTALATLSLLALSSAFADTASSTGTFTGSVTKLCKIPTSFSGTLNFSDANGDGFADSADSSSPFSYQSNAGCTLEIAKPTFSTPTGVASDSDGNCVFGNGFTTVDAGNKYTRVDDVVIFRGNNGSSLQALPAGDYTVTCQVTATF